MMTRNHALAAAIAVACSTTVALPALAQSPPTSAQAEQKRTLQTVIVTGTRAFDRTAADSLKPIDILTPQELVATGAPDLTTALRTLLPSFNFPQPSLTDATDATQPAQLRGLSPDETLVLINGKRQHTTAVLNVNGSIGRGSSPWTSRQSRSTRSSGSRCCATAPRPSTDRTQSQA